MINNPQLRKLFIDQGYNPDEFDDPTVQQQPTIEQVSPAANPTPKTTALGAFGESAASSVGPTAVGGLAAAKTIAATAPFMGPWSLLPGAVVGIGAGIGAKKLQNAAIKAVAPETAQKISDYEVAAQQEHPWATGLGGLATTPVGGFYPKPAALRALATGAGKLLTRPISSTVPTMLNPLERASMQNALIMPTLGVGQDIGLRALNTAITGEPMTWPTPEEYAMHAASGAFLAPNRLGVKYGFPALPEDSAGPLRVLAKAAREAGPTRDITQESATPEGLPINTVAPETPVDPYELALSTGFIPSDVSVKPGKIPPKPIKVAPTEADVIKGEEQKALQKKIDEGLEISRKKLEEDKIEQATELAKSEAYKNFEPVKQAVDTLKKANIDITPEEYLRLDPEIATAKVREAQAVLEERARVADSRRLAETKPVEPPTDINVSPRALTAVQTAQQASATPLGEPLLKPKITSVPERTPELLKPSVLPSEKPLVPEPTPLKTAAEASAVKGPLGYSEVNTAPPIPGTEPLKLGQSKKVGTEHTPEALAYYEALAAHRGIKTELAPRLKHEVTGKEVRGAAYPRPEALKEAVAKINPNIAHPETWVHESEHIFLKDLFDSGNKYDRRMARRAVEATKKSETYKKWLAEQEANPNLGKFPSEDIAAKEFLTKETDWATTRNIFEKDKSTALKNWMSDFWAGVKEKYGNASPEEYGRILARRYQNDPGYMETKGYGTKVQGQGQAVGTTQYSDKEKFDEMKKAAEEAKPEQPKVTQPTLPLEGDAVKFQQMRNLAEDSAKYEELGKRFKELSVNPDNPEFKSVWEQREALKNKYDGKTPDHYARDLETERQAKTVAEEGILNKALVKFEVTRPNGDTMQVEMPFEKAKTKFEAKLELISKLIDCLKL